VPILDELATVTTHALPDILVVNVELVPVEVQDIGTMLKSGYEVRLQLYAAIVPKLEMTFVPVSTAVFRRVEVPLEMYAPATPGLPTNTRPVVYQPSRKSENMPSIVLAPIGPPAAETQRLPLANIGKFKPALPVAIVKVTVPSCTYPVTLAGFVDEGY